MYISPNTYVRIMEGVPWDNTYSDTALFDDPVSQYNWFIGEYTHKVFTEQSFQRVNKNTIRLEVNANDIYSYNYLMFQNTAYGNKWFYAFILETRYINDNCAEIEYEIDVIQTWWFDTILKPSYVEREHSATDSIGDNIAPEPVDLGPIICTKVNDTGLFDNYVAVIAMADTIGGST